MCCRRPPSIPESPEILSTKQKAIRGMEDVLPDKTPVWRYLEDTVRDVLGQYGYGEIRLPIVERTELFKRSIGEVTDIVEKEMYTFDDRNGDSLTLRPEGTAGCVRAAEEHGLLYNQTQRLWYTGPMFRYERPQKGRYRQFHQIGVEAFGYAGPDIDAEQIALTHRLWQRLGLLGQVELHINTLGSSESREAYKAALVSYLSTHAQALDADSQRRLHTNPLRILDSKEPATQALLSGAPSLMDYLDEEAREHFHQLRALLDAMAIPYVVNPRLVRGLDYYGKTVFEWMTSALGAQGTVCAGGRYDGLVAQLGGRPTPAVGFAMGVERLILLLESFANLDHLAERAALYWIPATPLAECKLAGLIEQVRTSCPGARSVWHQGGGKLKKQLKKADDSGAELALLIGEQELEQGIVSVKFLRSDQSQVAVKDDQLIAFLQTHFQSRS